MKKTLLLVVLAFLLVPLACQSDPREKVGDSFKKFSLSIKMANEIGMNKFGDSVYVKKLLREYDGITWISELWPKKPFIIDTQINGDQATIKVEGPDITGKQKTGIFTLTKTEKRWVVSGGEWEKDKLWEE